MFCVACGTELAEGAVFCSNCGRKLDSNSSEYRKAVQFTCKGCNTVMRISTDTPVLQCPCCGSTELILENDDVTIERIKSKTILEHQKSEKELELEKLYYAEKKEDRKRKREWKEVRIIWTIFLVVFLLIFGTIFLKDKINEWSGKVEFPFSYHQCEGETYTSISMYLADAGFTNVTVKPLNDLDESETEQNGLIYRIMVNGDPGIYSDTMVKPDAKIIIYYHSMKEK
ncbi:MAG: zinc-ribbon domain-containing protein [Clostridia bacterium]|nr:zinc-ribbon domain-containing protein [Clostridia bacterium]